MYFVKLLFSISIEDGNHEPQFEEQIRFLSSENEEDAFEEAQQIGNSISDEHNEIKFQFVAITMLNEVQNLQSGFLVCNRIFEKEHKDRYIQFAKSIQVDIESKLALTV